MSTNEKIWYLMEYFSSSDGAVGAYKKKFWFGATGVCGVLKTLERPSRGLSM